MEQTIRKKLFNVFNPMEPLPAHDPRYVDCSVERGSQGLLDILGDTIALSDKPTCQLLSGNTGCGKTTELWRLRERLEKSRYFVVYCESDDYIDVNDVEYADVLLAVLRDVSNAAKNAQVEIKPGRFVTFFVELMNILGANVDLNQVQVDTGLLSFDFGVKTDVGNRQRVRDELRRDVQSFIDAVNEMIEKANTAFQSLDYEGLVVIVDNLDRIVLHVDSNTRRTNYEDLFIYSAIQLRDLACPVIYTLPLALLNSSQGGKLGILYGKEPVTLPMIPVAKRDGSEDSHGIAKLMETLEKRIRHIDLLSEQVFYDKETMKKLCVSSGGYIRRLMSLAQSAVLFAKGDCITNEDVGQAVKSARDNLSRGISPPQWVLLREISINKRINNQDSQCMELLDSLAVLEYRDDGGSWYDVSSFIREAEQFIE
jgi:hypothetical protein